MRRGSFRVIPWGVESPGCCERDTIRGLGPTRVELGFVPFLVSGPTLILSGAAHVELASAYKQRMPSGARSGARGGRDRWEHGLRSVRGRGVEHSGGYLMRSL